LYDRRWLLIDLHLFLQFPFRLSLSLPLFFVCLKLGTSSVPAPNIALKAIVMYPFTPRQTMGLVSRLGTKSVRMRLEKLLIDPVVAGLLLDFKLNLTPPHDPSH
jgi:hypothetical protein